MNKIILLMFALSLSVNSFSQQTTNPQPQTKESYFKKSAHQKTAAWILLGGGAALTTVGLAIGTNRAINELGAAFEGTNDGGFVTGEVFFYTGIASMLGSIPLFIASSKNQRKGMAASAFFKIDTRPVIQQSSLTKLSYPAIGVKLKF